MRSSGPSEEAVYKDERTSESYTRQARVVAVSRQDKHATHYTVVLCSSLMRDIIFLPSETC